MIKMGSLFSGIGGLDLGLERSIPGLQTVWQVEKEPFCRSVLERHWPNAKRYNDVRTVGAHNLEPVQVLCAGFPCQSISIAGKMEGLSNEEKSGLWWQVHRLISELRPQPQIIVLENVANILRVGGPDVVGSLARIGYDCEWTVISAAQTGAPHLRRRWFAVAFPTTIGFYLRNELAFADSNVSRHKKQHESQLLETTGRPGCGNGETGRVDHGDNYWRTPYPTRFCRVDDGIPKRLDRLKALGNAVVPQCAEWVGQQIVKSRLLEVACLQHN
tara:strand:- start:8511 stop:9329 length:819 start_codon:yes stop_codon:yes gene_type:complete